MCYCHLEGDEVLTHRPKVLLMNEDNSIHNIADHEKHGPLNIS